MPLLVVAACCCDCSCCHWSLHAHKHNIVRVQRGNTTERKHNHQHNKQAAGVFIAVVGRDILTFVVGSSPFCWLPHLPLRALWSLSHRTPSLSLSLFLALSYGSSCYNCRIATEARRMCHHSTTKLANKRATSYSELPFTWFVWMPIPEWCFHLALV